MAEVSPLQQATESYLGGVTIATPAQVVAKTKFADNGSFLVTPNYLNGGSGGSGIASINGDTTADQFLSLGSTGTDANWHDDGLGTHTLNLPSASVLNRGLLTKEDWAIFSSKQSALTFPLAVNLGGTNANTAAGARSNLGLGSVATHNASEFLFAAANLSDLDDASEARSHLGLGTIATHDVAEFLEAVNDLSDVADKETAFDNVSPLTTKGDLLAFVAGHNVRFPAGTNGTVLGFDNSTPSGLVAVVLPGAGARVVSVKTANYSVSDADSGTLFVNTGAAAEVDFTLPTAAVGLEYDFYVRAAQIMKIIASGGASILALDNTGGTFGGSNNTFGSLSNYQSATQGNYMKLIAISTTEWIVIQSNGAWSGT